MITLSTVVGFSHFMFFAHSPISCLIYIFNVNVNKIKAASSDERALARASYTQISTNQRKGRSCPMTPPTTLYVKLLQSYS